MAEQMTIPDLPPEEISESAEIEDILAQIVAADQRLKFHQDLLTESSNRRTSLIREAKELGISGTQIAKALDISKSRVNYLAQKR